MSESHEGGTPRTSCRQFVQIGDELPCVRLQRELAEAKESVNRTHLDAIAYRNDRIAALESALREVRYRAESMTERYPILARDVLAIIDKAVPR